MRIDILCKPDCGDRCERTLDNVRRALSDLDIKAEVHVYKDVRKMIDNRVYVTPALVVDDAVRISGRIPDIREIRSLIVERPRYRKRYEEVA
ncbi:MAG: thioredoxin family protein [Geothermobacteraceae bacterium]|nr:MAG: thioredoxin family protein [Deltaproteobacteria bacterium]